MSDQTKPEWSEYDLMLQSLPYTLTKGVTATREGIYLDDRWDLSAVIGVPFDNPDEDTVVYAWWFAAERLRYREGEPWSVATPKWNHSKEIVCGGYDDERLQEASPLHRLAAILCDDAEGFRVLHWCIDNLCKPVEIDGVTPDE